MYDVIVAGGGPIGSYAAYRLADAGHKVLVLEQKPGLGEPVCCTGIVGQECVNTFAIADRVILKRANSANIFPPSGNPLHLWREETQACILDRAAFDMAMAVQAQEKGADYLFDSSVKVITIDTGKVRVEASRQGKGDSFDGRVVIIASGFGSGLTERLNLGRVGDFTIGAQAEVAAPGLDEVEVYFGRDIAPRFFGWLVPTSAGMARVGLMSRRNAAMYLRKWLASLAAQGKTISAGAEPLYGGIPLKPLTRTYDERLIVMGDAAGQVKPTSGGGIYYGLLCADIAADVLHRALEDNDLSARRLSWYEQRWKKKLGRELRIGYWARKLFERLSDGQVDRIFKIVKANGIDEALLKADDLSFDWHSRTLLKLIGHQVISGAIGLVKLPFRAD